MEIDWNGNYEIIELKGIVEDIQGMGDGEYVLYLRNTEKCKNTTVCFRGFIQIKGSTIENTTIFICTQFKCIEVAYECIAGKVGECMNLNEFMDFLYEDYLND